MSWGGEAGELCQPALNSSFLRHLLAEGCRGGKGPMGTKGEARGHLKYPPLDEQIWVSQPQTPSVPQPRPEQHPLCASLNRALAFGRRGRMLTTAEQMQTRD